LALYLCPNQHTRLNAAALGNFGGALRAPAAPATPGEFVEEEARLDYGWLLWGNQP
jgi:hypothetical protein